MSRGTAGLAAGAAATTVYLRPDILIDWVRNAAIPHQTGGNSSKEIGELTRLVEQLAQEVRNGSTNSVTVVTHDKTGDSLRTNLIFYATVAASAGALYLVIGRGWRLGDLSWVTQHTFRRGISSLSAGLDSLSTRLADVKSRLAARIAEVSRKQDEAAVAAAALRAHLADVGADVEAVRGQVGHIHNAVLDMDAALSDIGVNQRHALHGIYVLCKAVSELSAGSHISSKAELLEFTQSPVWQRMRPQGLEGILNTANNAAAAVLPLNEDVRGGQGQRFMLGREQPPSSSSTSYINNTVYEHDTSAHQAHQNRASGGSVLYRNTLSSGNSGVHSVEPTYLKMLPTESPRMTGIGGGGGARESAGRPGVSSRDRTYGGGGGASSSSPSQATVAPQPPQPQSHPTASLRSDQEAQHHHHRQQRDVSRSLGFDFVGGGSGEGGSTNGGGGVSQHRSASGFGSEW